MLQAHTIDVLRGGALRLKKVSAGIVPGQLCVVLGPNGAGKSTLLKALSGELPISSGVLSMQERPLDSFEELILARRRAVLPQKSQVSFGFTGGEVAMLGRIPHGDRYLERGQKIVREAMELVRVHKFFGQKYHQISGGEQQRVQLARVLAQVWEPTQEEPNYLLLDEPTAALDLSEKYVLMQAVRRFCENGGGALVVTHDLELAGKYGDHLVFMKEAKVVAQGRPEDVMTEEVLQETYSAKVRIHQHLGSYSSTVEELLV